jgi:hypothetical protein
MATDPDRQALDANRPIWFRQNDVDPIASGFWSVKYEILSVVVRWREAVCMMMLMQDPHITPEGVARLGRHLAQIFRQDLQVPIFPLIPLFEI